MTNAATVGWPRSSRTRSVRSTDGRIVNSTGASLRKPMSCDPWPTSAVRVASRRPASREESCTMRYSTSSPDSAGASGGLSNVSRSSQRSATSAGVMVWAGRGSMLKPRGPLRLRAGEAKGGGDAGLVADLDQEGAPALGDELGPGRPLHHLHPALGVDVDLEQAVRIEDRLDRRGGVGPRRGRS
jgi:hypothetical protein